VDSDLPRALALRRQKAESRRKAHARRFHSSEFWLLSRYEKATKQEENSFSLRDSRNALGSFRSDFVLEAMT